jgi:hypothetical protein
MFVNSCLVISSVSFATVMIARAGDTVRAKTLLPSQHSIPENETAVGGVARVVVIETRLPVTESNSLECCALARAVPCGDGVTDGGPRSEQHNRYQHRYVSNVNTKY